MRRFEKIDERSAKFWTAEVQENCLIVVFGALGSHGQRQERRFTTAAEARRAHDRKISEKINKGYHEVFTEGASADLFSPSSPLEMFPLPPYLSDLFCPSPGCKALGPGSLYLVGGTQRDPALRCHRCGRKDGWRSLLRANFNIEGSLEAIVFLLLFLLGLYFLPIQAGWRVLLAALPVILIGEFLYDRVRHRRRLNEIERKIASEDVLL